MSKGKPSNTKELPYQSTLARYPEYAQAIGMVSIEIANIEIMLGELLAVLLHVDRHFGRIIYLTPQANLARIQILENVLVDTLVEKSPGRVHVEELISRARSVIGKRHELIHNAWGLSEEDPKKVSRRSLPFKETHPAKLVPINELRDLVTQIRKLGTDVYETVEIGFKSWPPYTWPQKPNALLAGAPRTSTRPPKGKTPKRA